jgi:hypothetical protein
MGLVFRRRFPPGRAALALRKPKMPEALIATTTPIRSLDLGPEQGDGWHKPELR